MCKISVSLMCADPYYLREDLKVMETVGVDFLHMDIMDNHFVPNFGLSLDWIRRLREHTNIPFDFHLMVEHPEQLIPRLDIRPRDLISIHFEAVFRLEETVEAARKTSAKLIMAMNPGTPICMLDDVFPLIDGINFMTIKPGFAGQKILPHSIEKACRLSKCLAERTTDDFIFEVDGNMNLLNVERFKSMGANVFVLGTSSVYRGNVLNAQALQKICEYLNN